MRWKSASEAYDGWTVARSTISAASTGSAFASTIGFADATEKRDAAKAMIPVLNCILCLLWCSELEICTSFGILIEIDELLFV